MTLSIYICISYGQNGIEMSPVHSKINDDQDSDRHSRCTKLRCDFIRKRTRLLAVQELTVFGHHDHHSELLKKFRSYVEKEGNIYTYLCHKCPT